MVECLFLEDLEIGALWTSPSRTVTETDVVFFAGMTGDYDPLHTDHEFAAKSHYGKPIAHGLLGLSLMAGLSSTTPRLRNLALTKVDTWEFHRPYLCRRYDIRCQFRREHYAQRTSQR